MLAVGLRSALAEKFVRNNAEVLARDGVTPEGRYISGVDGSARLLNDSSSGADIAILLGGTVLPASRTNQMTLASPHGLRS